MTGGCRILSKSLTGRGGESSPSDPFPPHPSRPTPSPPVHLDALFDPEVRRHRFPVLRADDVEETVEDATAHAAVEDFDEPPSQRRLWAAESGEERRL